MSICSSTTNAFSLALLVELRALLGDEATAERNAVRMLCDLQMRDGGWPSCAGMRVTRGDVYEPWLQRRDAGAVYRDTNRVLTTATAVRALTRHAVEPAAR